MKLVKINKNTILTGYQNKDPVHNQGVGCQTKYFYFFTLFHPQSYFYA